MNFRSSVSVVPSPLVPMRVLIAPFCNKTPALPRFAIAAAGGIETNQVAFEDRAGDVRDHRAGGQVSGKEILDQSIIGSGVVDR